MIILSAGCRSLMQLMQDDKKRGGSAIRTTPMPSRPGQMPQAYLTVCSSPERQTR